MSLLPPAKVCNQAKIFHLPQNFGYHCSIALHNQARKVSYPRAKQYPEARLQLLRAQHNFLRLSAQSHHSSNLEPDIGSKVFPLLPIHISGRPARQICGLPLAKKKTVLPAGNGFFHGFPSVVVQTGAGADIPLNAPDAQA